MTLAIGLYVACELIANVTAVKPIVLGTLGIVVPAGVFIYALTFTLLDLIHERLGKHGARQVIATAFSANLLLAAYAWLTVWWPAPAFFDGQASVARVLGATPRIVGASLVAYLVAALVDAEIFAWWRARVGGYRWGRVLVSNAASTAVDSIVFVTLAFAGVLPVLPLVVGQYAVKMAVTVLSLPMIYAIRAGAIRTAAPQRARAMTPAARAVTGVGALALVLGCALGGGVHAAPPPAAGPRPEPGAATPTPSAVNRARAAIVGIKTRIPPDRPSTATLGAERAGSATVLEPDGLAVTVGYLVLEAIRIDVTLEDGRATTARVVGHDFESGLALIRLDPSGAPYSAARLGRSAALAPGQPVAIVGVGASAPPVGVMGRVTSVGPFVAYWEYLLEHAVFVAPHHPAFGGAALVDPDGALVGVVSLRLEAGHLAIPIDLLGPVRAAMVSTGRPARPPRPWLGVRAVGIDGGVGIAGVSPSGPAHAGGLRAGDVVLRVNGERVADVEAFYRRLWAQPVGAPLELGVWREGALLTVTVRPRDRYATFDYRTP